jgi:hypothetical protein
MSHYARKISFENDSMFKYLGKLTSMLDMCIMMKLQEHFWTCLLLFTYNPKILGGCLLALPLSQLSH